MARDVFWTGKQQLDGGAAAQPEAGSPLAVQLRVVQERQALVARRSAAKLFAKRSANLKARQLQEDNLRADKEDELRLELEVRVGLERMKPQDNVHVVVVKEVQRPILAGASRCCSCASPSTISPT